MSAVCICEIISEVGIIASSTLLSIGVVALLSRYMSGFESCIIAGKFTAVIAEAIKLSLQLFNFDPDFSTK